MVYVTNKQFKRDIFSLNVFEVPKQGTGTGFIWDKRGLIVTNFHVIQRASKITITLKDQTHWDAKVVGVAPDKDLAVLRITAPHTKLIPLKVGDSSTLQVGNKVLAIGNPFGLDHSISRGIISALGRKIDGIGGVKIHDMIQTDAAINQGNSGGPLINSSRELIGMNTMIFSTSGSSAGLGFAVPVDTIKRATVRRVARRQALGIAIRVIPALAIAVGADNAIHIDGRRIAAIGKTCVPVRGARRGERIWAKDTPSPVDCVEVVDYL